MIARGGLLGSNTGSPPLPFYGYMLLETLFHDSQVHKHDLHPFDTHPHTDISEYSSLIHDDRCCSYGRLVRRLWR